MKHLDDKYFVPFPEFFAGKEYDTETYMGISDLVFLGVPIAVNIIFTKSENLEDIKRSFETDWSFVRDSDLSADLKLAVLECHEKLQKEKPAEPRFKLEFKKGPENYEFSMETKVLTIFVENEGLPDSKRAFFFPGDIFLNQSIIHQS